MSVVGQAVRVFGAMYQRDPDAVAVAPGRVNLIGDHTDYNGGFVLPMAIDHCTAIAGAERGDGKIRVGSSLSGGSYIIGENEADIGWVRYVRGVCDLCRSAGLGFGGLDLWIESSVPTGSGLSSSAALCVGTATLIETMANRSLGVMQKAALCQRVEHEYASVPCGIMDQAVIAGAEAGSLMLLDCQSLSIEHIAIDESEVCVLIADTRYPRTLAGSEYASRRQACEEAARRLGVGLLREVKALPEADDQAMRCARHVVSENARVLAFVEALGQKDWPWAGRLMYESHRSLRDDFRITGEALDAMVRCAQDIQGVYGARMTGAGMGGCAVVLVRRALSESIIGELAERYRSSTGNECRVFAVQSVGGASGVRVTR